MTGATTILHASCVAHAGKAVLILGPSGSGKSTLALRLLALGARLVSDDRTEISCDAAAEPAASSSRSNYPSGVQGLETPAKPLPAGMTLMARCPADAIRGLIEVRGIGILRADPLEQAPVTLTVDLGQLETDRLPPFRTITILGTPLPLVLRQQNDHLAESLLLYLTGGRQA